MRSAVCFCKYIAVIRVFAERTWLLFFLGVGATQESHSSRQKKINKINKLDNRTFWVLIKAESEGTRLRHTRQYFTITIQSCRLRTTASVTIQNTTQKTEGSRKKYFPSQLSLWRAGPLIGVISKPKDTCNIVYWSIAPVIVVAGLQFRQARGAGSLRVSWKG